MRILTTLPEALNRRSDWQIWGSYVVGAWLVLQLAETLSSLLGLPLWFGSRVVALLSAGVPVVLLTTFVQGRGSGVREHSDRAEGLRSDAPHHVATWRSDCSRPDRPSRRRSYFDTRSSNEQPPRPRTAWP